MPDLPNGLTGASEAAAFHGLALNRGYAVTERLELALKALDLYEAALAHARSAVDGYAQLLADCRCALTEARRLTGTPLCLAVREGQSSPLPPGCGLPAGHQGQHHDIYGEWS